MSLILLPDSPDPSAFEAEAEALLEGVESGDDEALDRWNAVDLPGGAVHPDDASLDDARTVVALECGVTSWAELQTAIHARHLEEAVKEVDAARALAILAAHPSLATYQADADPTALHWAALKGMESVVRRLLALGADIDGVEDRFGATPIGWANEGRQPAMVDLLVDAGAHVDLSRAAALGRLDLVMALVEDGAPLRASSSDDWLPLAQAAG